MKSTGVAAEIVNEVPKNRARMARGWCFIEEGIPYDTALVSLDLALLYARQRRTADLKRLAEEMVPIFSAQDVHREATAALVLFQDAARREAVTAEMVREVAAFLEAARGRPELRFG